ncbi:hypothetical protein ACFSJY_04010 [Thalassotalea euphylliae]|uniref:hypothetical protein n=1 Tax=Thalassotalea euphylliae TaxID=1655234 RepID=UPI003635A685
MTKERDPNWGGARPRAGRKPRGYKSVQKRIPEPLLPIFDVVNVDNIDEAMLVLKSHFSESDK